MIKLSDIAFTARKIFPEDYDSHTEVRAEWSRTEVAVIHRDEASPKVIAHTKEMLRHRLISRIYQDLIDPIEELYYMAARSPNIDPVRCQELHRKIRAIMEARG